MTDLDNLDDLNASDYSDNEQNEKPVIKEKPIELNKYGKPKRVMSDKQKATLAAARLKGAAKRKELAEIKRKEQELKVENHLIKKLELQKRIKQHERRKKRLEEVSDSEDEIEGETKKVTIKKKGPITVETETEIEKKQKAELALLKEQLDKLQLDLKEVKTEQKKPKRRIVKTIIESDLEDEPDSADEEHITVKKAPKEKGTPKVPVNEVIQLSRNNSASSVLSENSVRSQVRRPLMDTVPTPKAAFNPVKHHERFVEPNDAEIDNLFKENMRKLFPNYR
jgi:hypothetical protein